MSQWVINGIRAGIKTTVYPAKPETAAGVTPGLPVGGDYPANQIASLIERCPTRVFSESDGRISRIIGAASIVAAAFAAWSVRQIGSKPTSGE